MTLTMSDMASSSSGQSGKDDHREPGPRDGQATRRVFAPSYKLAIVTEYDSLTAHGARGALLRREGLYQSHIVKWRKSRDRGSLMPKRTQAKTVSDAAQSRRLKAENKKLIAELEKTKAVLEVMGKVHVLLELLSESKDSPPKQTM